MYRCEWCPHLWKNTYSKDYSKIDSILGMCENEDLYSLKSRIYTTQECKNAYMEKFGKPGTYDLNASGVVMRNGLKEKVYQRILIKRI